MLDTTVATCPRGHPLTPDNTYRDRNGRGVTYTRCRTCRRSEHRTHGITLIPAGHRPAPRRPGAWQPHARCRQAHPDDFTAHDGETGIPERARRAAARFCAHCPVQRACDSDATAHRDVGLWGGTWRDYDTNCNEYRIRDLIER